LENQRANDTDGSALAAQPGKSQGRPPKPRARSPPRKTACPNCVLPRGPCPSEPEPKPSPGQQPQTAFSSRGRGVFVAVGRLRARIGTLTVSRSALSRRLANSVVAVGSAGGAWAARPSRLAWSPPAATSNRACGSPAHGSPTFFTGGHSASRTPRPVGSRRDDGSVKADQPEPVR
jgi:hypothetical protein